MFLIEKSAVQILSNMLDSYELFINPEFRDHLDKIYYSVYYDWIISIILSLYVQLIISMTSSDALVLARKSYEVRKKK